MNNVENFCRIAGCSDKVKKVHFAQSKHGWSPHPPQRFVNWWKGVGVEAAEKHTDRGWTDVDAVRAFNCEAVQEAYREAKEYGIA